jgi:hypothetical protein
MRLFWPDPPWRPPGPFPTCDCFNFWDAEHAGQIPTLHAEEQDTSCKAWKRVVARIEAAIDSGEESLSPLDGLSGRERTQIVTLPESIERLVKVQKLMLYGTHLVRIPPQIAGMSSLQYLDVYTSRCLHFLPYEITRCAQLRGSRVSTRCLYGNYKHRPPFPHLEGRDNAGALARLTPDRCSVCARPLEAAGAIHRWITLAAGTDYVPLLVNACSPACVAALPKPADDYVPAPHVGGRDVVQPPPRY